MTTKPFTNQTLERRKPRQERALQKIELILEAAMRLIDRDGIDALTTNAIAELAGVSIGTLYQYFKDKQAILDALMDRELGKLNKGVMAAMSAVPSATPRPGERLELAIRAVSAAYSGRRGVHRKLMAYSLARGTGTRLQPLFAGLTAHLTQGVEVPGQGQRSFTPAEAFVLTHAIAGVLRGTVTETVSSAERQDIETALVQLVQRFLSAG